MTAMFKLEVSAICGIKFLRALLSNVHPPDQTIFYQIDVLHHAVHQYGPFHVSDYLMNVRNDASLTVRFELSRIHVGVNHSPLTRPIIAYTFTAMYPAAFHPIGPFNFRMH